MATTGNNMNNLTTLIKRLEAATSRLEDIASSNLGPSPSVNGVSPDALANVAAAGGSSSVAAEPEPQTLPPAIEDFDTLINQDVKEFVRLSDELGGLVSEQAASVLEAFTAERKFLVITTKAKKPDIQSSIYMEILKELQSTMGAVNDITTANRGSPLFNHLSTVSEGIAMLVWITVEPKPADYVAETLSSAQYWGNRVLKEYKDRNYLHVEWAQAFTRIFKTLTNYIKQHYISGLSWNNAEGMDAAEALRQVDSGQIFSKPPSAPPIASSGAPPPPPPPPPLPTFDKLSPTNGIISSKSAGAGDMGAVFEQISQGESVTSNLRKVDPSSQTHKNPSLRAGATVPPTRSDSQSSTASRGKSPIPGKKPKPESMRTKKPPRKELDGNKWIIENFDLEPMLEIEASITHSILISRCTKTTIRVLNKANAISIDNSSQVSLIVDSLVSSVDVIKSPRFALQVLGALPTLLLDQVDGATVYLGKESLHTEIFTSKCAAVNVNVPDEVEVEGDYKENPLPEQIKSVIRRGKVLSEIVEHAG